MNKRSNRETFRFPFDIDTRYFIGLACIFLILSIKPVNNYLLSQPTAGSLERQIENDITDKMKLVEALLNDSSLLRNISRPQSSDSVFAALNKLPVESYIYEDHQPVFWSSIHNKIPLDTFPEGILSPYKDSSGYFCIFQKRLPYGDKPKTLLVSIKIKNDYGFENQYFTRNFLVGDNANDFNFDLSFFDQPGAVAITAMGHQLFYLVQNNDFFRVHDKNGWRLFLSALPFIFFGVSIHTFFKVKINRSNTQLIFGSLLLTVLLIRGATYLFGFPNDFSEYALFSDQYCAVDSLNRSLGDLFINMCLLFWILLYFIINVMGKVYDLKSSRWKYLIAITVFALAAVFVIYFIDLIFRIIRDSVINFDTTVFSQLNLFSFIGLLCFMVIFVNILYLSIIAWYYLNVAFKQSFVKYTLVFLAFLVSLILPGFQLEEVSLYFGFTLMVGLFMLQDYNYLRIKFDFNSYKLLIWMMLVSGAGAFLLTLAIEKKELIERRIYAEKILFNHNGDSETLIREMIRKLKRDSILKAMMADSMRSQSETDDYVSAHYLSSFQYEYLVRLGKRDDSAGRVIDHSMFIPLDSTKELFRTEGGRGYFIHIMIEPRNATASSLEIELINKDYKAINQYPDLMLVNNSRLHFLDNMYSSALYQGPLLMKQRGDYTFLFRIKLDAIPFDKDLSAHIKKGDYDELWIRDEHEPRAVVVVAKTKMLYLFTTLFAYIFFIYFVTVTLYILGNIIARSNLQYKRLINLMSINLRLRIHFSILVVELLSFLIIGYFTSTFLINKVEEEIQFDLNKSTFSVQQEFNNLKTIGPSESEIGNKSFNAVNALKLKSISDRLSLNFNMYSLNSGKLIYTSLPEIFKHEIIADRLEYNTLKNLQRKSIGNLIEKGRVGLLNFLSSYFIIHDDAGKELAIVELPFFLSNSDQRSETTTIITTLINIYIFVFLVSAVLAFFLTKSVTKPFTYIVKQFTKINLTKTNEPLKWFDSDEIGLLIKEYNRMLRKLENSTVLLAKNEREMAWREMAKQVAHEIKNPLTPMKLSLQMLERAIKNNASNVNETAVKVTKTLVEQIDNLSLIATNFSNFAKLPSSKKEVFHLNEFLYSVTGMYHDDQLNEFLFMIPDYEILLFADKSQIIRVFTNIIQNAIQSIPEDRKGNIALTVSKIKNNFVRVSISDNGEGISEEKGKSLFQPYFTTKTSGTGLGLAMCKDIIEESGGKISFDSVVDEGTVFHIDLPVHIADQPVV